MRLHPAPGSGVRTEVITAFRLARLLLVLLSCALGAAALWLLARAHPLDLPWTRLDLAAPIGVATGRKLTALTADAPLCRRLLARAGVRYTALSPRDDGDHCGYRDAVRLTAGGARTVRIAPPLAASCSVAAAVAVWEWEVVQPAAVRRFGQQVARIDSFGTYSCRRIRGGRAGGRGAGWSEHARAGAFDVAGFTLADGHVITVARDWPGKGRDAAFLRDVRDGACRLFATVLSPDFNAAHHDHLHLDQAARGTAGWRACR